jgi:hypothetical protein
MRTMNVHEMHMEANMDIKKTLLENVKPWQSDTGVTLPRLDIFILQH